MKMVCCVSVFLKRYGSKMNEKYTLKMFAIHITEIYLLVW